MLEIRQRLSLGRRQREMRGAATRKALGCSISWLGCWLPRYIHFVQTHWAVHLRFMFSPVFMLSLIKRDFLKRSMQSKGCITEISHSHLSWIRRKTTILMLDEYFWLSIVSSDSITHEFLKCWIPNNLDESTYDEVETLF